jgi:hypothetical protein
VRAPDGFPVGDVHHVDARAHDVGERRSGLLERGRDVRDRLARLRARVAVADDAALPSVAVVPDTHTRSPTTTARE